MKRDADIGFDDLPDILPVFPLPRVILLPRVQLPLNIFEPRYLAMIDAALATHRLVGMVQPQGGGGALCRTGCAGRIVSFKETDDGRYLITLRGVCRYDLGDELPAAASGHRQVVPDWSPYRADMAVDTSADLCRDKIMATLRRYLDRMQMFCDQWGKVKNIGTEELVSTLSVICPFDAAEKQALLEAPDLKSRARMLEALLEIAAEKTGQRAAHTCH